MLGSLRQIVRCASSPQIIYYVTGYVSEEITVLTRTTFIDRKCRAWAQLSVPVQSQQHFIAHDLGKDYYLKKRASGFRQTLKLDRSER